MKKPVTSATWVFLFLIFFTAVASVQAEETLKLEITLEDPQDSSQSIAIINGESVKEKSRIGSDEIIRISSSSVTVKNVESGEERVLTAEPAAAAPEPTASPASTLGTGGTPQTPANPPIENPLQKIVNAPGKLMNRFWELRALRDLAIINNAAVSYFNDKKTFPKNFSDLISANFLPAVYASGVKEKYRFYFIVPPDPKDFGVHADPQDPAAGMRSFFVGTDTVIREERSGPAGPKSQPHAY